MSIPIIVIFPFAVAFVYSLMGGNFFKLHNLDLKIADLNIVQFRSKIDMINSSLHVVGYYATMTLTLISVYGCIDSPSKMNADIVMATLLGAFLAVLSFYICSFLVCELIICNGYIYFYSIETMFRVVSFPVNVITTYGHGGCVRVNWLWFSVAGKAYWFHGIGNELEFVETLRAVREKNNG